MAINTRAIYFYNANRQLIKQGRLTVVDEGAHEYLFVDEQPNINKGALGTVQIAVALPSGTFSGGSPLLTIRTPKGYMLQSLPMSVGSWHIKEGTTETTYQIFYMTLTLVGQTHSGGKHDFVVAYFTPSAFTPLDVAYYKVDDGTNNDYEDLDSSAYDEIFGAFTEVLSGIQEDYVDVQTYLENAFGYAADEVGADFVQFNTEPTIGTDAVGKMRWNDTKKRVEVKTAVDKTRILGDADTEKNNTFEGDNTFEKVVVAELGVNLNNAKAINMADGANAKDGVNKSQLDAGLATKVGLTGDQTIAGNKTFTNDVAVNGSTVLDGPVYINNTTMHEDKIVMQSNKIEGLGAGTADTDAINKAQLDAHNVSGTAHDDIRTKITNDIGTHNTANNAHADIRNLIAGILGAFVYRGKILLSNPTQQQLTDRLVELMTRQPEIGDVLVDNDNNEWYFNGYEWSNYGQFIIGLASALSDGLMTKEDFVKLAELLTGDQYYSKTQVDALVNAIVAIQGVDVDPLTPLENEDTIPAHTVDDYDLLILRVIQTKDYDPDILETAVVHPSDFFPDGKVIFNTTGLGSFARKLDGTEYLYEYLSNGQAVLHITGIKFLDLTATNIDTSYSDTNYLNGKTTQDAVNRALDSQAKSEVDNRKMFTRNIGQIDITYSSNGSVSLVDGDHISVIPTYDGNGNVLKITETFKEDSKVFETTFTRDLLGRIVSINKEEVV